MCFIVLDVVRYGLAGQISQQENTKSMRPDGAYIRPVRAAVF